MQASESAQDSTARRSLKLVSTILLVCLWPLIDILLPRFEERFELDHQLGTLRGEILLLTWIGAKIKQQELAAINEQLPSPGPDSPLLAVGPRYSPEQLPVSER
jgi:hypothetical protein